MKNIISIQYGEIALKGQNRREFVGALVKNIKRALDGLNFDRVSTGDSRVVLQLNEKSEIEEITKRLKRVFGIEWFSIARESEKDVEKIKETILDYLSKNAVPTPIKVEAKRSDKSFPLKSNEISSIVGKAIDEKGYETDLENQKTTIRISINQKSAIITFDKIPCFGGLPVGSSGKVICLLSGGIDSPVAAIQMMKRGCSIDLLHFYQFPEHEQVMKSKIADIVGILRTYGFDGNIYLAPYSEFYKATFTSIPPRKELVVFRRFIIKVANRMAMETRAIGIATGDNLAQVASQTLENLYVTNEAAEMPVYRPLVCYNKQEIIKLAKEYGTYEASIKEYKDCCSLIAAAHPETKTKLEEIKELEIKADISKIVDKTMELVKKI
jgi:thiamine biosynthesis protein ThiI